MEALGRSFNALAIADDVYVNMQYCEAVSFLCFLAAGDTYTLTEAKSAAGLSAQVLATITRFHVQATPGVAWVEVEQAAASTMVTTSAQDVALLHVGAVELSAGFTHLKLASTSTGLIQAITHDLSIQRDPALLPLIGA